MDVDPTGSTAEDFVPSHALDALHLQIIDHFTAVLKEIADGVRKRTGDLAPAVSTSVHAPAHRRKEFNSWTIGDCLEYLGTKQVLRTSTPPLRVFLLRRNAERGWRRGQDWSRQDWMNALEALHDVGMKFQSGVLLRSLEAVMPHVFWIFNSPMRPTGI
ncbi:hypothetical protein A0H81_09952 [Grifola frondosa]|uniref:Uncharacterized protein n=1 Tax=Grifola frondosa TaxID=5627 RepID=A0A1C7M0P8_GRIFR|nr:hypothetical protein A0H81_09952 [Grifola frondosa]